MHRSFASPLAFVDGLRGNFALTLGDHNDIAEGKERILSDRRFDDNISRKDHRRGGQVDLIERTDRSGIFRKLVYECDDGNTGFLESRDENPSFHAVGNGVFWARSQNQRLDEGSKLGPSTLHCLREAYDRSGFFLERGKEAPSGPSQNYHVVAVLKRFDQIPGQ